MSLADSLKPTLYAARAIAGRLGFRTHTAALLISTTSGTHTGDGSRSDVETPITEADGQSPRTRWLRADELAVAGLTSAAIEIGPITPEHSGGGTDLSSLQGLDLENGDVRLVRITGPMHPDGTDYRITGITADRALRYMIRAVPVGTR